MNELPTDRCASLCNLLTIVQDDSEGSSVLQHYVDFSDQLAVDHFIDLLDGDFSNPALKKFRKQLLAMTASLKGPGQLTQQDPSVQGRLTVRRGHYKQ